MSSKNPKTMSIQIKSSDFLLKTHCLVLKKNWPLYKDMKNNSKQNSHSAKQEVTKLTILLSLENACLKSTIPQKAIKLVRTANGRKLLIYPWSYSLET